MSIMRRLEVLDKRKRGKTCPAGILWRFQPKGASLRGHKSMTASTAAPDDVSGVWAFPGLRNALRDLYDWNSYAKQVRDDGAKPELVAICASHVEDGPEDFDLVRRGRIVARFDADEVKRDLGVQRWARKEGIKRR